jgi:hypothetical protein
MTRDIRDKFRDRFGTFGTEAHPEFGTFGTSPLEGLSHCPEMSAVPNLGTHAEQGPEGSPKAPWMPVSIKDLRRTDDQETTKRRGKAEKA